MYVWYSHFNIAASSTETNTNSSLLLRSRGLSTQKGKTHFLSLGNSIFWKEDGEK